MSWVDQPDRVLPDDDLGAVEDQIVFVNGEAFPVTPGAEFEFDATGAFSIELPEGSSGFTVDIRTIGGLDNWPASASLRVDG